MPGHRPGVPETPGRPGGFQKLWVIYLLCLLCSLNVACYYTLASPSLRPWCQHGDWSQSVSPLQKDSGSLHFLLRFSTCSSNWQSDQREREHETHFNLPSPPLHETPRRAKKQTHLVDVSDIFIFFVSWGRGIGSPRHQPGGGGAPRGGGRGSEGLGGCLLEIGGGGF